MDCLFCKIISGEIPCQKVYENDYTLAFLDVSPINPGHTLVISKKHYKNFEEIPEEELNKLIQAVKEVGKAIKDGLGVFGYNISVNNDPIAGQIIPHIHFHIIPRKEGDGLELWQQGKYKDGEAEEIKEKLAVRM